MRIGCLNVNGMNVGKLEDVMTECKEWKLDVLCLTETHLREELEFQDERYSYRVVCKGRSKQKKKGGGIALLVRKECDITCEMVSVGDCEMSEDLMGIKLEYMGTKKRETLFMCVCYMTVESQEGKVENKRKHEVVKQFVRKYCNEKVLIVGDMNAHIGLLGEHMNFNGSLLRETCEGENLEILNETIAEGKITWCRGEQQSAVDYALVNALEREKVVSVWVDEGREFTVNSDHNLLLVRHECRVGENKVVRKRAKWKLKSGNWLAYKEMMSDVILEDSGSVDDMNEILVQKVKDVATRSVGRVKGKTKNRGNPCNWWNEEIKCARNERKVKNRKCRSLRAALEKGENVRDEYQEAWNEYVSQQKRVKILTRNARVSDERMKLEERRGRW